MNDEEWARWKDTFAEGGRPMPNIVKRAASDRRRALVGVGAFYVIAAGEVAIAVRWLADARRASDVLAPGVVLVSMIALAAALQIAMRGTWSEPTKAPLALLDALERRHLGRRKLMRLLPRATALLIVATNVSVGLRMMERGRVDATLALWTVLVCSLTAGFVWLVNTRVGRKVDRELREVAEARRLLSEDASA